MSGAGSTTCIARKDGALVCWGDGGDGVIGDGAVMSRPAPTRVPGLTDVIAVGAGEFHTCVIHADGTASCWGHNSWGQVGNGTTTEQDTPATVTGLANAVEIATGQYQTCARLSDGSVSCWGHNAEGELGNNTIVDSSVPVQVMKLSAPATHITVGDLMSCAILADDSVACWGGDNPTGSDTKVATAVPALAHAVDIAGGCHEHSCAALTDGTAWCWGLTNTYGELGDGSLTPSAQPVRVAGLTGVVQVAVGVFHSCARTSDGAVWCWGGGYYDQLGQPTIDPSRTPLRVPGLPAVDQIIAGCAGVCARAGDRVWCWGDNEVGELGDGTFTNRIGPVATLDVCKP